MPVDHQGQARGQGLVRDFVRVQALLLRGGPVDVFLSEIAALAAGLVPLGAACGVTTADGGPPVTAAASDLRARRVDAVQYAADDGPCLDALGTGVGNSIPDLAADRRWPAYREGALRHGVRCSMSLPLTTGDDVTGVLNIYGFERTGMFTEVERRHGEMLAAQTSTALTLRRREAEQATLAEQLERALEARSVIDHALGILMAQQHCPAEQAFALLRLHSQHNNRPMREVAAEIVVRVSGSPPTPAKPFRRDELPPGGPP